MACTLVVVDPQIDFISGTLPVPHATEAMLRLAQWIVACADRYDTIVLTMDQHPWDHCSFVAQGGPWPSHCVRYTEGAAIYPPIHQAIVQVLEQGKHLLCLEKATSPDRDAYSAFTQGVPKELATAEHIYIAGLAGDYCVEQSHRDIARALPEVPIERLEACIAYINRPKQPKGMTIEKNDDNQGAR